MRKYSHFQNLVEEKIWKLSALPVTYVPVSMSEGPFTGPIYVIFGGSEGALLTTYQGASFGGPCDSGNGLSPRALLNQTKTRVTVRGTTITRPRVSRKREKGHPLQDAPHS